MNWNESKFANPLVISYKRYSRALSERANQKDSKPQFYQYKKYRKRIETLFSQLCDQFMIRRNYAKSFDGFKTRILAKITALTVVQYINKTYFNRNINNLKTQII